MHWEKIDGAEREEKENVFKAKRADDDPEKCLRNENRASGNVILGSACLQSETNL